MSEKVNLGEATRALRMFVETVNATGGLIINDAGENVPAADEDWMDLADAYLAACEALGVEPWNVEAEALEALDEDEEDDRPEHSDFDPGYGGTL